MMNYEDYVNMALSEASGGGGGTADTYSRAEIDQKLAEIVQMLGDYVKNTDYAYFNRPGLACTTHALYGLDIVGSQGEIRTAPSGDTDVDNEGQGYKPLVPKNIPRMMSNYNLDKTTIPTMQAALADAANAGQKNLLKPEITGPAASYGVTCTPNGDGTFTLKGANTGESVIYIWLTRNLELDVGTYVLSGLPANPPPGLRLYDDGDWIDSGDGATINIASKQKKSIIIRVTNGTNVDGIVIKPMVCRKSLYNLDPSFQPCAMNNAELTARIAQLEAELNAVIGGNSIMTGELQQGEKIIEVPGIVEEAADVSALPMPEISGESGVLLSTEQIAEEEITDERKEDF